MTGFTLYPYQQESLDYALKRNTIVNLPTGYGKTLIAAKLVEHHLRRTPQKRVAFIVPTRPLVEQQSAYCRKHCQLPSGAPPVIQKLVGQDQAQWDQSDWDKCMQTSHILLGTAALFQQVFVTDKCIPIGSISLIVFDECHNACGNSPMAVVMRDGIAPYQARGLPGPRILGLTASFINGNLRDMEQKRRTLEALLLSTLICPDVPQKITDDRFKYVRWNKINDNGVCLQAIEDHVERVTNHVGNIKETSKVVRRCTHVYEELGSEALLFYIDKVIVDQIKAKASLLKDQGEYRTIRLSGSMMRGLPALKNELQKLRQELSADPMVNRAAKKSPKVISLINLLVELFGTRDTSFRGIVFVEQVALVSSLAKTLNDSLSSMQLRCGAVAGTGYQSETDRQTQLDLFKSGNIRILAATAALEEGIDVPECAFIVRYTSVATTKAHIQGAGRARHPNAVIYYFENNPRAERQKEAALTATAKDMSLSLTREELMGAVDAINLPLDQGHPYPFRGRGTFITDGSGEVNVFNAKQIFNQYCSITLGSSVQPKKDLYQYSSAPGEQKVLSKIRFPTPNGWHSLGYSDYKSFWGRTNMDGIVIAERSKSKSQSEKEEMCFVYLVVVLLREQKYLGSRNRPDSAIKSDVKRTCPLSAHWSNAIAIKNTVFQSYTP